MTREIDAFYILLPAQPRFLFHYISTWLPSVIKRMIRRTLFRPRRGKSKLKTRSQAGTPSQRRASRASTNESGHIPRLPRDGHHAEARPLFSPESFPFVLRPPPTSLSAAASPSRGSTSGTQYIGSHDGTSSVLADPRIYRECPPAVAATNLESPVAR